MVLGTARSSFSGRARVKIVDNFLRNSVACGSLCLIAPYLRYSSDVIVTQATARLACPLVLTSGGPTCISLASQNQLRTAHDVIQAVCPQLVTWEVHVSWYGSRYGICGGRSDRVASFSSSASFFPFCYYSTIAVMLFQFIYHQSNIAYTYI
jgi:hypothetical protein